MNISDQVEYWFSLVDEDLQVAESNFAAGHYVWCLLLCHLTLEKAIKGLYVQSNSALPPRSHDLVKLSSAAGLQLEDDRISFLLEMNRYNIESRYPDYKNQLKILATKDFTVDRLIKTKELLQWLRSLKS